MKQTEPKVIPLKELLRKGVCYEDFRDFGKSIYKDVYDRANEAVCQIVEGNERFERERRQAGGFVRQNTEIANVISFIGRRGTGKSSTMLSYQEAMSQQSNDRYGESLFQGKADMEDIRFFSLECIDAAALEESESVFTLVLAQMLTSISEARDDDIDEMELYPKRSLMQNLEDIYKDYNSLKEIDRSGQRRDYSAIENLRHAASSQRIRTSFEKLVAKYLQLMRQIEHRKHKKEFLVIAIDDLDMSHYNERISTHRQINIRSYEIMRDISKYFTVPGVIVLVAYNHINLQQQISGFFISGNAGYYNELESTAEIMRSGGTLASEFMEKVFTPVYRIYMPSWRKEDYSLLNFRINIGNEQIADDIFACFREKQRYEFSIKELILILYAHKIGIYYDNADRKRHFLEPDSLRGLNSLLCLLLGQNIYNLDGQSQLCIKQETDSGKEFKRIMDDVYFRFIHEKLYVEKEKITLNELMESKIDMRSEKIVQLVSKKIDALGRKNKLDIKLYEEALKRGENAKDIRAIIKRLKKNDGVRYSYAELVHSIYHMTRDGIYTKEFVACILHSYSCHLTQLYRQYKEEKSELLKDSMNRQKYMNWYRYPKERDSASGEFDHSNVNYQLLKGVIGDTVLGKWAEYYMPKFNISEKNPEYPDLEHSVVVSCVQNVRGAEFKGVFSIFDIKADIKNMIYECIYLMSMYPDILQWRNLQVNFRQQNETVRQVEISHKAEKVEFEPAAFIKISILYIEYLPQMERLLLDAFETVDKDEYYLNEFKRAVQVEIKKVFGFLWDEYCNWDAKYGNMILPVYAFDFMYNMIKHLFNYGKVNKEYALEIEKNEVVFLEEFWNMILDFHKYLQDVDEFYCLNGSNSFANIFFQCPYIKNLKRLKEKNDFALFIGKHIEVVFLAVLNEINYTLPADENEKLGAL